MSRIFTTALIQPEQLCVASVWNAKGNKSVSKQGGPNKEKTVKGTVVRTSDIYIEANREW